MNDVFLIPSISLILKFCNEYVWFFRWETNIFYVLNCLVHAFTEEIKVTEI